MKKTDYNDEQLAETINSSRSLKEAMYKLGYTKLSGNWNTVKNHIKRLGLDTSHFMSRSEQCKATRKLNRSKTMEDIFSKNSSSTRSRVKSIIIKDNLIDYTCIECGITEWHGKKLCLQLDHINGISNDHRLENLRFLCPNCHSLTDNFAGKNLKGIANPQFCMSDEPPKPSVIKQNNLCIDCEIPITGYSTRCQSCNMLPQTKINWPEADVLLEMVKMNGYKETSKKLGVHANVIRKRLRSRGLPDKIRKVKSIKHPQRMI